MMLTRLVTRAVGPGKPMPQWKPLSHRTRNKRMFEIRYGKFPAQI